MPAMQLEKLVAKNSELSRENLAFKRNLMALEELQQATARRCHACQKAVQDLVGWSPT